MEWFWQMIEQLQKNAAFAALQSFSPIDWVFFCALLWGMVRGSRLGFSDMLGHLLGIVVVTMATLSFYPQIARALISALPMLTPKVAEPLAFFLLSVFLWLSVSWCVTFLGKIFRIEAQGLLKTLGGMAFGVLHILFLLSFLAQFLLFIPAEPIQQLFKPGRTYTGYTVSRFVPDLHKMLMNPLKKPKAAVAARRTGV